MGRHQKAVCVDCHRVCRGVPGRTRNRGQVRRGQTVRELPRRHPSGRRSDPTARSVTAMKPNSFWLAALLLAVTRSRGSQCRVGATNRARTVRDSQPRVPQRDRIQVRWPAPDGPLNRVARMGSSPARRPLAIGAGFAGRTIATRRGWEASVRTAIVRPPGRR